MYKRQPASYLERKQKATTRFWGSEQKVLLEPTKTYLGATNVILRSKTSERLTTSMPDWHVPDDYLLRATLLCGPMERMGEHILDRRYIDIAVKGLPTDYREVKIVTYRGTKMGLAEIQSTI